MSGTPETDDIARGNHVVPTEWAQQLERERDEARELHGKALSEREATEKEVDAMLERSLKAERERDDARESLKHISEYGTDEINAAVELRQKLATALVERDEAREALMRIEDLFLDGTDIYADRENMGLIARAALEGTK